MLEEIVELIILICQAISGAVSWLIESLITIIFSFFNLIFRKFTNDKKVKDNYTVNPNNSVEIKQENITAANPKNIFVKAEGKNTYRFKYVLYILLGLFFLSVIALYIANSFFFQPIMKNIFNKLSTRTQINMTYSNIQGNFFTGNFKIDKLRLTKQADGTTNFDIEIDNITAEAPILNAILSKEIHLLNIKGINGNIDLVKRTKRDDGNMIYKVKDYKIQNKKIRKKFVIENLEVNAGKIILTKQNSQPLDIVINKINTLSFRNEHMIFDLLFKTNVDLLINSHALSINKKLENDICETSFTLSNFPVNIIAAYIDNIPFNLFQNGTINIKITNSAKNYIIKKMLFTSSRNDITDIEINDKQQVQKKSAMTEWNVNLRNVTAQVPDDMPFVQKVIAKQVVNYINKNSNDKSISFKLSLDEDQFTATISSDAKNLWNIIAKNLLEQLLLRRKE